MQQSRKSSLKIENMERKPVPESAGAAKLGILAVLVCIIVAAVAWWLIQPQDQRDAMTENIARKLDNMLDGTPLAGLGRFISPASPPPPHDLDNPVTETGTLAGRQITGTIAAPLDFGEANAVAQYLQPRPGGEIQSDQGLLRTILGEPELPPETPVTFSQEIVPQVTEDDKLRPDYIAGLAGWLAARYRPGPRGGSLGASVQGLNQECGVRLAGLAQGGRAGLLRYAFHPAMITALYNLYIQRFMADLNTAAANRGLDEAQTRQFHTALAGHAVMLASSIEGAIAVGNLDEQFRRLDSLAQKTVDANADLTSAVFELDEQRQAKASSQTQNSLQMRVDGAAARYRRAADDLAQAQTSLVNSIRKHSGQGLDAESLLFLAAWVARREHNGGQAVEALQACVAALRDFSRRCRQIGEE